MLSREDFLRLSLETNLFFQRIMKEHLFFIETSLQPIETARIAEADRLKKNFEELLEESVDYAQRINLSEEAIHSNEFVTPYTLKAEKRSSRLTGASINTDITKKGACFIWNPGVLYRTVRFRHQGSQCQIIKPASRSN